MHICSTGPIVLTKACVKQHGTHWCHIFSLSVGDIERQVVKTWSSTLTTNATSIPLHPIHLGEIWVPLSLPRHHNRPLNSSCGGSTTQLMKMKGAFRGWLINNRSGLEPITYFCFLCIELWQLISGSMDGKLHLWKSSLYYILLNRLSLLLLIVLCLCR